MNYLLLIIETIAFILSFVLMLSERKKIQENGESLLTGKSAIFSYIIMFFAPVFAQAVFYYGWRETLPKKASQANKAGWIIVIVYIIVVFWVLKFM